jgi:hypothetical protein
MIAAFQRRNRRFRTTLLLTVLRDGRIHNLPFSRARSANVHCFRGWRPIVLSVFMPMHIRRCVECPKCSTRYLIGFSPYRNGTCLIPTAHGSSDEYTLYCSCCQPHVSSQWKWSDMKAFAVAKAAHERRYGNGTEIVPVAEKRSSRSTTRRKPLRNRFSQRKIS